MQNRKGQSRASSKASEVHRSLQELAREVEEVLRFGDEKHGPDNWRAVPREKWLAALMRHVGAHEKGETYDPETGLPHLTHAVANIVMIMRTK